MLKNKRLKNGKHLSQYIGSWGYAGGRLYSTGDYDLFIEWLKSLGLNKREINDIAIFALSHTTDLLFDARNFLSNHN